MNISVSIKKVANKSGVSTATVSHVINGTRFVKEETKQRVIQAMDELDYVPNHSARSLRSRKTTTIGLIIPDISNYFFTSVVKGIETVLQKNGYHLIVSNSNEDINTEIEQLKLFNSQMVQGVIIASSATDYSQLEPYIKKKIPIVFIDREPNGNPHDFVSVDNKEGANNAVKYLQKIGHKRIGIITGIAALSSSQERLEGYKEAMLEKGLSLNDNLIKSGNSKFNSGFNLARELYEEDVTALFIANNLMTIGAVTFFKEQEINIPEEIALIGFDDYEWAIITDPPLSTIKQPSNEIGKKAAEILLRKINGTNTKNVKYRFPTDIIIRESC